MSENKPMKNGGRQLASDLFVGGVIGAVFKTITAPIETIKLYLNHYKGIGNCFIGVYADQGGKAFWCGNLVRCRHYASQQGCVLAFNDFLGGLFPKYDGNTQFWPSLGAKLLSGGLAGAGANTICYPFDFARTRLASDVKKGSGQFNGIFDCIVTTVRQQDITRLYTGWGMTVPVSFIYRAGQLGIFIQADPGDEPL
eukprot:PhM_4_TR9168/c0_g1_i1/m.94471/K05863/SLC25A4S, ANT; solute carrier family 25 (mitochondrial adenine nucleotide translocator), member 4/5/6/31